MKHGTTLVLKKEQLLFLAIGVVLGMLLSMLLWGFFHHHEYGTSFEVRSGMEKGGFTNPLLECEIARDAIASAKEDFTPDLEDFVALEKRNNKLDALSVYFRDLNNGPVVNVGANESFIPASLLKVPVLISYLRYAEDIPGVLSQEITYTTPIDVGYTQEYPPEKSLELGKTYTAKQLLEQMAKYSDNQALILLSSHLPKTYQEDLYGRVGVDNDFIWNPNSALTVRQYSIFFRILFNSSFLTQKNSEYALKLLSESTFKDGLVAGVPGNIPVSHKFGEREVKGLQQFHDCGIIYYPKHPYMLCVMTRGGATNETLVGVIKRTSAFVYAKIEGQYKESEP